MGEKNPHLSLFSFLPERGKRRVFFCKNNFLSQKMKTRDRNNCFKHYSECPYQKDICLWGKKKKKDFVKCFQVDRTHTLLYHQAYTGLYRNSHTDDGPGSFLWQWFEYKWKYQTILCGQTCTRIKQYIHYCICITVKKKAYSYKYA